MIAYIQRRAPRSPALPSRRVGTAADAMLRHLGLHEAELSVLLTNDTTIAELNSTYRKKEEPTDVLAFPQDEGDGKGGQEPSMVHVGPRCLGDIVISLDTAARQAQRRKQTLYVEVRFLLAHGLLHLVGYDHATASEKRTMDARTDELVIAATAAQRT